MDGLKVLKNCIACVGSFNSDSELMKRMHKSYYYSQFKMGKLFEGSNKCNCGCSKSNHI